MGTVEAGPSHWPRFAPSMPHHVTFPLSQREGHAMEDSANKVNASGGHPSAESLPSIGFLDLGKSNSASPRSQVHRQPVAANGSPPPDTPTHRIGSQCEMLKRTSTSTHLSRKRTPINASPYPPSMKL
ncbi:hypothetical protein CISG_09561 [Coccidioides immitis RMSCC 3703]|uniref:Uncharacterized protein n=1 Tax=Coccidioides immitis RMSCC 3703 TaxID=454286 RepID=A0A0J8RCF9_COCIT|nr:hypothetical protein CISG_09561 [Coccidioides immitis RMSCC 3703]